MIAVFALLGTAALGWAIFGSFDDDNVITEEDPDADPQYDSVDKGGPDDDLLNGTNGNDLLIGKGGADTLEGGDGDDDLRGWSGTDLLRGGDGSDSLDGGTADDTLRGGSGEDLLNGADGDDLLKGGAQNDLLDGGEGSDTLHGQEGDDAMLGSDGDDSLFGDAGVDELVGGPGKDDLWGGDGDDFLLATDIFAREITFEDLEQMKDGATDIPGLTLDLTNETSEADTLHGEGGNDWLMFGPGDEVWAGDGEDLFTLFESQFDGSAPATIVDFNNGSDDEQIAIFYKQDTPPPVVTVQKTGDDAHVFLDGVKALIVEDESEATVLSAIALVEHA
ncbi:MAG: hypothetical protein OQK05_10615 [Pseudopelagicola sp.]|nr:hypothetical protein [Pseudopelagicola sp.]